MADRKKTPDILGSLLGGADIETPKKTEDQNTIKPEYHKDSKPEVKPTIKPVRQKTSPPKDKDLIAGKEQEEAPGDKVKATYYISSEIVEALEEGWIQLRRLTPKDQRSQISKSLIVELALQTALEELDNKGSKSLLAKKAKKDKTQ
jgi:hypothetical protein